MSAKVLLLTPDYMPLKVITWQRAVVMYFNRKIDVLETYDEDISSPTVSIKAPAVVVLRKGFVGAKRAVKFSRTNVFARDQYRCGYCGQEKKTSQLNYDHVIPRHQGGKTEWSNIISSCYPCNLKKANRTPEQAGMKLRHPPVRPKYLPVSAPRLNLTEIPEAWAAYCKHVGVEHTDEECVDSDVRVA
jgi:5-methylcytosine-specific restriction endonuclease McrA